MTSPVQQAVSRWKFQAFRRDDLPYGAAVNSLTTGEPMIEAKRTGPNEWVLCRWGTNVPAVFSYAGVFADADDYLSGNLVMGDNEIPASLEESRRYANWKCAYSYAFNTVEDPDFYLIQKELEAYMVKVPGFNPGDFDRRPWQSGSLDYSNSIFWMNVPMFIRRKDGERKPKAPTHLHPWVLQAERKSRRYRANPARPAVRAIEQGRLCDISQAKPSILKQGDAVAVRFKIAYIEADRDWYPQFLLTDIVRVCVGKRRASEDSRLYVATSVGDENALENGEIVDGESRGVLTYGSY
ncbi:hypothetical protein C8Q76DRAFT_606929 [Earliella scabrosa]|nr:hypothetical protein C8Q76DRAFT_606929 [Earliella scabrosa]